MERSRCYLVDCCEMDPTCLLFTSCVEVELDSHEDSPFCQEADCDV
jgi:hypothetical protein